MAAARDPVEVQGASKYGYSGLLRRRELHIA